jgi:hypothetical protein
MKKLTLFLTGIGFLAGVFPATAGPVTLVDQGTTKYIISIPDDAIASEKYAANELQAYVKKSSGVTLAVLKQSQIPPSTPLIQLKFDARRKTEEWSIEFNGASLVIAGGRTRGVLYGVYDFLEKFIGVRWLNEDIEVVPTLSKIEVPSELKIHAAPDFAFREIYDFAYLTGEKYRIFRTRKRLFFQYGETAAKYGFTGDFGSPGRCHTMYEYSRDFPREDYFSLSVDGHRQRALNSVGPGNVCFSKPEVREYFVNKLRKYIEDDRAADAKAGKPPRMYYDISINDNNDTCHCQGCRERVAKYGESGLVIDFINGIADAIKPEYPEVTLMTFAYGCSLYPPKNIKTAQNVIIRVAQLGPEIRLEGSRDSLRSIKHLNNAPMYQQLLDWHQTSQRLGVWDYWIMFTEPYASPYTQIGILPENIREYKRLGVEYYFGEAENYWPMPNDLLMQSFMDLRLYLASAMLLNCHQDENVLTAEFMNGFYGAAAPMMKEYLKYLILRQDEEPRMLGIIDPSRRKFLDVDFFKRADALFNAAEKAVAHEPKYLANVKLERITVDEAVFYLYDTLAGRGYKTIPIKELLARLKAQYKIAIDKYYLEPVRNQAVADKRFRSLDQVFTKPKLPEQFANRRIIDYYWTTNDDNDYGHAVADPDAITGFAAEPKDFQHWPDFHSKPVSFGVYDKIGKTSLLSVTIPFDQLPQDEKYHWVNIGKVKLAANSMLWLHWSWHCTRSLNNAFEPIAPDRQYEVNLSYKVAGPAYVKGSTKPNALRVDRIILVEAGRE